MTCWSLKGKPKIQFIVSFSLFIIAANERVYPVAWCALIQALDEFINKRFVSTENRS
ncbi:hypothetical protein L911_1824 [Vibrio fluvialis I21563]|nr:hypothetical protein L911_1824 [Vibrio fluvialis I21563]